MMARMVVGTDRIATLHRRLATIFAAQLQLRLLPMPIAIPELRESLQWPAPLDRDPASAWLREVIADVARGLDEAPEIARASCREGCFDTGRSRWWPNY